MFVILHFIETHIDNMLYGRQLGQGLKVLLCKVSGIKFSRLEAALWPTAFYRNRSPRHVQNPTIRYMPYIVKHNYVLGGMVFTVCKAQLHVSAIYVGHLQIVQ